MPNDRKWGDSVKLRVMAAFAEGLHFEFVATLSFIYGPNTFNSRDGLIINNVVGNNISKFISDTIKQMFWKVDYQYLYRSDLGC